MTSRPTGDEAAALRPAASMELTQLSESVRSLLLLQGQTVGLELETPELAQARRNAFVVLSGAGHTSSASRSSLLRETSESEGLADSEERFRTLVQNSSDVVTLVDADTTIRYQTPSVARVIGYEPADLVGLKLLDLLHPDDVESAGAFFAEAVDRSGVTPSIEWRIRHRDGRWLHLETIGNNLLHEATVGHLVLNTRDISERKTLERQLAHQAFHDPLTGLANRVLFKDRVERALAGSHRLERLCVVLFLDLDDFKKVNDSLGHVVGDELLVAVAERISTCLRPADTAARLGGDEFAILLEDARGVPDAIVVAERILEALRAPITLQGKRTVIETSVGIASSDRRSGADELLRNADIAMYIAKGAGKNRHAVFEPRMHAAALERLELESDLRRAVERGEFVLHYQPIVELNSGRLIGVEALVRWQHPQRGLLAPREFISLAEDTGLILPIGRWVIAEACRRAAQWHRDFPSETPLVISINLSGRQLEDPELVDEIEDAVERFGLDPRAVMLEITETVMMEDTDVTACRLAELRRLGARLSIDDFGTGYSSLRYLHSFPVDVLKIARPFVEGVGKDPQKEAFTRTIIELCRTLGLQAIAEGVESAEQAAQLRELGCELAQGTYLAEPVPAERLTAMLAEGRELSAYAALVEDVVKEREERWWEKVLGAQARPAATQ
jgi:diguanylate cyclase (GGDEF)-like protein/PAS domain S-box-containing protein